MLATPFLDITAKVNFDRAEQGLLGITCHPGFSQNGRFFVNYDQLVGTQIQTVIAEFHVSTSDPNLADPASERVLLLVNQPFPNHKAGQLAFGADGFLYFGLGDGGSGGDPLGNGQNLQTLLGKMMRIDVGSAVPYAIPPDNPFASGGGPTACAIPGDSRLIAQRGGYFALTSAKTALRRSIFSRAAETSAGTSSSAISAVEPSGR